MAKDRDLIVALDYASGKEALAFLDLFDQGIFVKVGMELFYKEGPAILKAIKDRGHRIFLDLKLHDIPNTVAGGLGSLLDWDVDILTIHCLGGRKMIAAARGALEAAGKTSLLMGVSVLTSLSQEDLKEDLLIQGDLEEVVGHYARIGREAGLDGVICSAKELAFLREKLGEDLVTICPGIRPKGASLGDQTRVVTPEEAGRLGADYIVVGRPIRQAKDPKQAYEEMRKAFLGGQA
ncbi:MAG: orotidine-5'-phosphate decarboxylase [Tissierellia bacterium]|nr:orotidine-5'-phosphate decarboxylase [Tissierellia bacterium]